MSIVNRHEKIGASFAPVTGTKCGQPVLSGKACPFWDVAGKMAQNPAALTARFGLKRGKLPLAENGKPGHAAFSVPFLPTARAGGRPMPGPVRPAAVRFRGRTSRFAPAKRKSPAIWRQAVSRSVGRWTIRPPDFGKFACPHITLAENGKPVSAIFCGGIRVRPSPPA